ncbi:hypothetical protein EDF54_1746 [Rathayibacter sp. PhB93]|uniref:hypothetical protein n=1 Tax=unclassified Rathayibacter TaxID=2609250 RepID=UPI000F465CDB|nr:MULTISPECIES: hypothetical protein [unclassified Rathayibacter]ROQ06777.1 hypothetical protein EDF54_1746 [Rathayibacter sp. PhB93]TDQ14534.1 hypothetical protein EDF17_1565 [Rathayibacter sp. PhB1]
MSGARPGGSAGRAPGARGRENAVRAVLGAMLALVPLAIGALVDIADGTAATPLSADPSFVLLALGGLAVCAAVASLPVGAATYLLDRLIERVWTSSGGRLAAQVVANALVGGAAGLLLGGLVAPFWRPIERALVFTGPWALAAAALVLLSAVLRSRRAAC